MLQMPGVFGKLAASNVAEDPRRVNALQLHVAKPMPEIWQFPKEQMSLPVEIVLFFAQTLVNVLHQLQRGIVEQLVPI